MDRGDAAGQVADVDPGQPGFAHHVGQGFLVGEGADAFGQIAVAVGVAGDQRPRRGSTLKDQAS